MSNILYDNGEGYSNAYGVGDGNGSSDDTGDQNGIDGYSCPHGGRQSGYGYAVTISSVYESADGDGKDQHFLEEVDGSGVGCTSADDLADDFEIYWDELPSFLVEAELHTKYSWLLKLGEANTTEEFNNVVGLLELCYDPH